MVSKLTQELYGRALQKQDSLIPCHVFLMQYWLCPNLKILPNRHSRARIKAFAQALQAMQECRDYAAAGVDPSQRFKHNIFQEIEWQGCV